MIRLRLDGIAKHFADHAALRGVDLDVPAGELLVIVGPSGGGKTTLLRIVAGLERPERGTVRFDDRDVTGVDAAVRNAGVVFARGALYPHLSVFENLAYGLRAHGRHGEEVERRVRDVAQTLRVEELLRRKPPTLSSGQAQRVALGRALVPNPGILLLDEPLANLDAPLRAEVRGELRRVHRTFGTTTLFVTHDQAEAMALGDRIALLVDGTILQTGTPRELYDAPATLFVAGFIGSPPASRLRGSVTNGTFSTKTGVRTPIDERYGDCGDAILAARADAFELANDADEPGQGGAIRGIVTLVEPNGPDTLLWIDWSEGTIVTRASSPLPACGDTVTVRLNGNRALAFDARTERPLPVVARV